MTLKAPFKADTYSVTQLDLSRHVCFRKQSGLCIFNNQYIIQIILTYLTSNIKW